MSASVTENLRRKLDEVDQQYAELEQRLLDPDVLADHHEVRRLSVRKAAIEPIVERYRAWREAQNSIEEHRAIVEANEDRELIELAREELPELEERADALMDALQKRLVTADDQSIGSVILEVRAGVGGDEAGLWAGDLIAMYEKFAAGKRWKVEWLQDAPAEMGGFKHATLSIAGEGVWAQLGYEGGTHQVKRVPATETQGRVHTSTATVAVLPEPEEVEVELDPNDVKESITTAQGPGGQNVNKVATAVHLIHEPTGIEVRMQETKSQTQNREKAWKLLKARLYEQQKAAADAERAETRNAMIGRGSRAEKIRTYRWKENIVVDHRTGESYNLGSVMAGDLQPVVDDLVERDTAQRLAGL
ncbi:MAG: PCRF domain-containing protein [Phycisphaerales bacterium]|nr:MAG: PCRF domain-containing protein [Phycisphaerales bacterium]